MIEWIVMIMMTNQIDKEEDSYASLVVLGALVECPKACEDNCNDVDGNAEAKEAEVGEDGPGDAVNSTNDSKDA